MSALDKCTRCGGHPRHAHTQAPEHPHCQNCFAVKATKYDAKHYFKGEEEAKLG